MSLFQTSAWQHAWWREWGRTPGFRLLGAGGAGASGLYLDKYLFKRLIPVRCLQYVGTNYRRISTPRTEYNSISPTNESFEASVRRFESLLSSCRWSEAVFRDVSKGSREATYLESLAGEAGWGYRVVDEDTAYAVETRGRFDDYLAKLGPNTRLRLYNRRKVLETCGEITLADAWPDNVGYFLDLLNAFHVKRWQQPCFSERSLRFHFDFLDKIGEEGGVPDLSILYCDGNPVSVLYNVRYRGRIYNIQSGFELGLHKKLSLGTLHLGYSIEDAFREPDVTVFDLLAGAGKNEDYKSRLATSTEALVSVMLVKKPLFKMLYWLKSGI
ncbi:MAG: GNAT family N-acetyltransferase [Marinobacter sp.]|nr:GNAT family N-acetyltransferase [Marinobacter sp.]